MILSSVTQYATRELVPGGSGGIETIDDGTAGDWRWYRSGEEQFDDVDRQRPYSMTRLAEGLYCTSLELRRLVAEDYTRGPVS